jgi:hypothetical protein
MRRIVAQPSAVTEERLKAVSQPVFVVAEFSEIQRLLVFSEFLRIQLRFWVDFARGIVHNHAGWFDERAMRCRVSCRRLPGCPICRPSWWATKFGPFLFSPESEMAG